MAFPSNGLLLSSTKSRDDVQNIVLTKGTKRVLFIYSLFSIMAFYPLTAVAGAWRLSTNTYKKTASTAFTSGNLVAASAGYLIPATSSTVNNIGIGQRTVTSAATDYASNTLYPVLVPQNGLDSLMQGLTASAVATDAGSFVDLTDAGTVNRGATSTKVIWFAKYLSATQGIFALNPGKYA